ncbi:MAG TPA: TolC family protein [Terriglobales bacterium]|jgi:outer membrane protein TolC|nr:TolC family protein [Terriglobales bacterium]
MSRSLLRVPVLCLLVVLVALPLAAQKLEDYSKSRPQFPNVLLPYAPRIVPPPSLANTSRIDQVMHDGKIYLSLNDAIALALENNLDLVIARYNLPIADTDVLRAKAGSGVRGVSTGVVQNTPGGTGTGIGATAGGTSAGGTSAGAGGAGAGTAGLVTSTTGVGANIDSYDPIFTSSLSVNHTTTPLSNVVTSGTNTLQNNTGLADFSYVQGFPTGTLFWVGFNNSRATTNSLRTTLSPALNSGFNVSLRQHLLAGIGLDSNLRFMRIARNNREIADVAFRQQVISTVSQIENIYWNLVAAYEDVRVQEDSVKLAEKTLADNQAQVEAGTLAPISVVQAKSDLATRQQNLIVSQTNLQLQQLLMKNAITRNEKDPVLAGAPVIPTDTVKVPATEPVVPIDELVNDALAHRPELAQSRIDLKNRDISKHSARNALLPTLDAVASYGGNGLSGALNPLCIASGCQGAVPGGYHDAFSAATGGDFPTYTVGLTLTIPIRNRSAQADQVRSELEYRQAEVFMQQQENQVGIEVRNAKFAVEQNRARVDAARAGVDLARQTMEAEQDKYQVGASTTTLVLQTQRDLVQAESNLVAAETAYAQSRVNLDQVTGLTLEHNNIGIDDAETGRVTRLPQAPYVQPRTDVAAPPSGGD